MPISHRLIYTLLVSLLVIIMPVSATTIADEQYPLDIPIDTKDSNIRISSVEANTEPFAPLSLNSLDDLLSNIANAHRNYNYQGLLTYEANGSLSTMKLTHRVQGNTVLQQLDFLDGVPRQVVREQDLSVCNQGRTRWGLWPLTFDVNSLNSLYHIGVLGDERVANRQSTIIDLVPKDKLRYGYRFNVDQQTGLLLKTMVVEKAQVIERTQFVDISLQEDDKPPVINDGHNTAMWRVPTVEPCHTEQFQSGWLVEWLPAGFSAAGNRTTSLGEQVLMFTDGFVSISVFIVTNKQPGFPGFTARRGASVAVILPLSADTSRSVVVVGEIPVKTARRIAASVKPQ